MDKYFKNDTRDAVRIKCLRVMSEIVRANRHMYEQDLLEKIVIPFMKTLDGEASTTVRVVGVQVLTQLLSECSSRDCLTLLDVLERVVTKPLEKKKQQTEDENDMADVHAAVKGLINIFRVKLCQQPPAVIARIYGILSQHLEDNYRHPVVFAKAGHVRVEIFQLFMALRVSESWHLGMCEGGGDGGVVRFSPFIVVKDVVGGAADGPPAVVERHKSGSQSSVLYISLTRACRLVIQSLSEEKDWNVLQLVLARVPNVLQNKAIITRYGKAIQSFVLPLVDLTSRECKLPDGLINKPPGLNRSEFHNRVFPVLAAMASFNEYLESAAQREMINSLHTGLLSKDCNRICISALTACALEMKRSMYHVIPQVLLNFSKISATKMIASPMLEFLSTLIRLPDIFSSFTDTNYMSVFAIALPFTNPFKFDAYIVSLAHHIIIMWFLKCRLCYRQNFVQFIVTGLNSNVRHAAAVTAAAAAAPPPIAPSKQPGQGGGDESGGSGFRQRSTTNAVQTAAAGASAAVALKLLKNMDSAERKRSSSLTDSSSSSRRQSGSGKAAGESYILNAIKCYLPSALRQMEDVNLLGFKENLTTGWPTY
jgi:tuberous sclerosis protein 2